MASFQTYLGLAFMALFFAATHGLPSQRANAATLGDSAEELLRHTRSISSLGRLRVRPRCIPQVRHCSQEYFRLISAFLDRDFENVASRIHLCQPEGVSTCAPGCESGLQWTYQFLQRQRLLEMVCMFQEGIVNGTYSLLEQPF